MLLVRLGVLLSIKSSVSIALFLATTASAILTSCPAAVHAQLDALYRWRLAAQDRPGLVVIASQSSRFTPQLDTLLRQAYAPGAEQTHPVDFDLFNGTQTQTFAAAIQGCRAVDPRHLQVVVDVRAGLRDRPHEPPQRLTYAMVQAPGGAWQIADIVYPGQPPLSLKSYLQQLIQPRVTHSPSAAETAR